MLQKIINWVGIILSVLILIESWFLINMGLVGAYFFVVFVLIIIFFFILFFISKVRILERKEASLIDYFNKLKEDYEKTQDEKNKILTIINGLSDGILILDGNNVSNINYQAEQILDVNAKEILYKPISELERFPRTNLMVPLLSADAKNPFKKEVQATGDLLLDISVNPLVMGKNYIGKFIILRDITKMKMIEKTKADFIALSVHQLNTPLSSMKLSFEMLLGENFGKINKEQKAVIEKMRQRNKMLIYLVSDLLNLDKIESDSYFYHWSLVDAEELVTSLVSSSKEEIKKKKIKFVVETPKTKLPKMILDKEKISFALQNIIDNAIKYTPVRGRIGIFVTSNNKELKFEIQDSGMGVPQRDKEKLFVKFFRASNAVRTSIGSGLGLFISKSIVEGHDGKIWLESKENEGSTFYVSIPIKEIDPSL